MSVVKPRVVLISRPTEYELLLARHGTRGQAGFFLQTRGQHIDEVEARHQAFTRALELVSGAIPADLRRTRVTRRDLDRFVFEPDDVVMVLGQDGLVANTAKYLSGQPVIGLNQDRTHHDGVLVPHAPDRAGRLLGAVLAGRAELELRTMVQAELDDGQRLLALNEIYVGHRSHQSSRYRVTFADASEHQSSSGVIFATGTGATGWARSISRERRESFELPRPSERRLCFFVREAFPSVATGTELTQGLIESGARVEIVSEMSEGGVLFGDGIESDAAELSWGMRARIGVAEVVLRLVR